MNAITADRHEIAWVAVARGDDDVTRQLYVGNVDGLEHMRHVVATNAHTIHVARLHKWKLPEAMQEPGLFDVMKRTQSKVVVDRDQHTEYLQDGTPRWCNWKKVLPNFLTHGEELVDSAKEPFLLDYTHMPRARTGRMMGRFLAAYAIQFKESLNVDYIRDMWMKDACFRVRAKAGGAVMFRQSDPRTEEYFEAAIMPQTYR